MMSVDVTSLQNAIKALVDTEHDPRVLANIALLICRPVPQAEQVETKMKRKHSKREQPRLMRWLRARLRAQVCR